MKKIPAVFVFFLFAASIAWGATITVTQPAGGNVALGSSCPIAWTASGVAGNVKIQLIKPGGALVALLANNLGAGSSPFAWTVASPAVAGEQYKVRVRAIDGSAEGASAIFTVVQGEQPLGATIDKHDFASMLKLESPNGGESWRLNTEHVIQWSAHFLGGKVMLQLYNAAGAPAGLIADDQPPNGSMVWKAGKLGEQYVPDGQYKVRVVSKENYTVFDMSDGPFTLTSLTEALKPGMGQMLAVVLPGIYAVFPGQLYHPDYSHYNFSQSLFQQAFAAFQDASCTAGGANATAMAGVHWFYHPEDRRFMAAAAQRSRIHFNLQDFAGKGAQLSSAKLKMKRVHAIDEDANCSAPCACAEYLAVLKAAMTSFAIPGSIGQNFPLPLGQAEFTLDVTDIVRQWLDGTLANHGLVLWTNEGPCSNCDRLCISCYEASLVLKME